MIHSRGLDVSRQVELTAANLTGTLRGKGFSVVRYTCAIQIERSSHQEITKSAFGLDFGVAPRLDQFLSQL